mgnify:CR=1 FL=1
MAASAALRILQPVLLFIAFLAIAIWFVIVQVLQPLSKTARAVAKRSPSSLDPIPSTGLPYELRSLVNAINDLMRRLGDSLTAQQRFASDAAHELRTPLAAIKLQAQLLARAKTDEDRAKYAGRLQQGVARATKLVDQLLTIARAILADRRMLILDEATSSVDTRLELLIQKAMKTLMQGRTSFVIAHRLSTIQEADKILVLKDGQIIEQGNHESLLADKGFYYDLYNSQFAEK